jgi:adenylate cyclase
MQAVGNSDVVNTRDAFISYASLDAGVADALCKSLEQRGISCWIAPRDVAPGALYADAIVRAINGAKILVIVLSQNSVASPHVGKEIERASSKRRPIIALRIDSAPLTPALEYFLSESQWVDASLGGMDAALLKLGEALRAMLRAPAEPELTAGRGTPASTPTHSRHRRRVGLAIVAAAAVIACAFVVKLWVMPHEPVVPTHAQDPLRAMTPTGTSANDKSVAVLPFEDLSEKKDQAYFSDGLSSELIDLLAKIPGLRVPARTSSFYFKGRQATLQDIAHALSVTHVLEGTVRKAGDTLRVTTDLVNVNDGTPMWSQSYDRKLDDVFKIQDEIAASVVGALKISLLGGASPRATPTANPAAYNAFLQCQAASRRSNRDEIARAVQFCEQAVALDPNFVPGWLRLADVLQFQFVGYSSGSYEIVRPRVYAAIQRTLALDPGSPEPHYAMANLLYQMDFDPAAAEVELKRAIALDPNDTRADWLNGYIADIECRFDDSLRALERAKARDPLLTDIYIQIGNTHYRSGKLADAAAAYRAALSIEPASGSVHYRLGLVALLQGNPAAALAEFEKETDPDFHAVGLPLAYDALNRKAEADRAIAAAEASSATGAAYQIALIHAARKDTDKAVEWLNRAYRQRDAGMLWIKGEPLLKDLRRDPRFQALMRQMHLA